MWGALFQRKIKMYATFYLQPGTGENRDKLYRNTVFIIMVVRVQ